MTSNWGSYSPLEGWAKNTTMGNYSPSSSTASIGGGGVDYNQNTAMNLINDPIGSMRFAQQGWGGDPSKSGGMGGSSFGAGDLINGLLGFLGTMQQMKIAKKQLALGKEQLASSKASYALDTKTQAEQYDREWRNRMENAAAGMGNNDWMKGFISDPALLAKVAAESDQFKAARAERATVPLLGESTTTGLNTWLQGGGLGGDTSKDSYIKPLASYGDTQQALTDQTNTAPTTAVKKPEEQTVRA